ncbi:MAG: tetratricopeptide repeat protein [Verrucomicrobiota bacterium]|nr:tetratricopeptide repeat protein [Verrucomicrobiota bacterium]
MRRFIAILLLALVPSLLPAQVIILKSGQRVETQGVRRSGDKVMGKIEVGGSAGEVGHPVASIAKIEFPEPQGLKTAGDLLSQGQADRALAEITPVLAFYDQFRDIAGSWWGQAAVVKVSALAAMGRDLEAEALATQVQKIATDPEATRALNLRIANSLVRKQDFEKANQLVDIVIKESGRPEVIADAWVTKGNILLAQKQWDGALLAFLHVPVFFQDEKRFVPPALLGSARAYRRLDDIDRAKKSLHDLMTAFPKSAEAAAAQTELQKL